MTSVGPAPSSEGQGSGGTQPPPAQATYQPPPPAYQQPPPQQFPQQQAGYYGGQQTTVVFAQPMSQPFGRQAYGPSPVSVKCPHCSVNITTATSRQCGATVWITAAIVCLIGCAFPLMWLGCCLIPFCIPSLYDVTHACPSCQREVGQYKAGGV